MPSRVSCSGTSILPGICPVTIARNVGQLPVYYYKTPAARRGYVFHDNTPLFPFGYGLSYTTFTFAKPRSIDDKIAANGTAKVSVTVTNCGSRARATRWCRCTSITPSAAWFSR